MAEVNKYSRFWMPNTHNFSNSISFTEKIMIFEEYRRAVANFVKIITGKDIPVFFKSGDDSYTDFHSVTISADVYEDSYDSTVGLALHEATHITDTDIQLLQEGSLTTILPNYFFRPEIDTITYFKDLVGWVEDNRIDALQYEKSPGYRGYYQAMMDRYFYNSTITDALKSEFFRDETLDSYFFRMINIINSSTDLTALKGLKEISEILNIQNIDRLKSTKDSLDISIKIFDVILKNIDKNKQKEKKKDKNKLTIKNAPSNISGEVDKSQSNGFDDGESIDFKDLPLDVQQFLNDVSREIENQKKFINNKTQKINITSPELEALNAITNSNSAFVSVPYNEANMKVGVIVLRDITKNVFFSDIFPFKTKVPDFKKEVKSGILLGTTLGKKLQIRNDERTTLYPRKNTGKIDQRLIAEFGFGNENVFKKIHIEKYSKAVLHISLDVSNSMSGTKISNSITCVTAIAKAASMVSNFRVIISLRGTTEECESPLIAIIYDSKKDSIKKIEELFPYLTTPSSTPEGLCYAAIQNEILASNKDTNSYFLNLSDGEPYFMHYSGESAAKHTRIEIEKMRKKGIKIMSYFIDNKKEKDITAIKKKSLFNIMYGKDAREIDVNNVIQLAKTLNEMFSSNDQRIII